MTLSAGTRIGPYEIVSPLGAGGMGEVHRARDTKLNRDVAIKVLLPAVANDPDRLGRFGREAQVLASLNHPNIAHIHGLEEANGVIALVMELVEGEDLSQRIARGPIPIDEALPIARQIAEALEAAHDHGIIHRDLKPANIKVRPDGAVKVLDFGLAKAIDPSAGSSATAMNSPTLSIHATEAGLILGTAAYMSPEQAAGKVVDKRSDLWAFGVVLMEMLTGRQVFTGETVSHLIAAVLKDEPDWTALPFDTPASIRRLLRRCLEKDRKRRIDSAGAARLEIDDALTAPSGADVATVHPDPAPLSAWSIPIIAGGIAMLVLAGGIGWGARSWSATSPPVYRTVPLAVEAAAETSPAWSRDGKTLAYSAEAGGHYQIFTRQPDQRGGSPAQLTTLPQDALFPFWHPSGDKIYFFLVPENALWAVGAAGGQPERVVENVFAGAISPDGTSLVLIRQGGQPLALWTASADGQNVVRGPELPERFGTRTIKFSPDGRQIGLAPQNASELWLADYPFSGTGFPSKVVKYLPPSEASTVTWFDWMPDGRQVVLQFSAEVGSSSLWLADLTSQRLTAVADSEMFYGTPSVSPESGRIAYAVTSLNWDIRQIDLNSGAVSPLIVSSLYDGWPAWLPSGEQVVYSTTRSGRFEIWMSSLREGWNRPVLTPDDFPDEPTRILGQLAVAPSGRAIAYQRFSRSGVHLFVSPLAGGKPVRVDSSSAARQDAPAWSPDSNWIVFASQGSIQKVRVGSGTPAVRLRDDAAGGDTRWSRTDQILYRAREGLTVVNADGSEPRVISAERFLTYDWAPDGGVVFAIREAGQRQLELITIDPKTGQIRSVAVLGFGAVSPEPTGYPTTIRALAISPDGKRAAFAYLHPESDIWMLEQVKN